MRGENARARFAQELQKKGVTQSLEGGKGAGAQPSRNGFQTQGEGPRRKERRLPPRGKHSARIGVGPAKKHEA